MKLKSLKFGNNWTTQFARAWWSVLRTSKKNLYRWKNHLSLSVVKYMYMKAKINTNGHETMRFFQNFYHSAIHFVLNVSVLVVMWDVFRTGGMLPLDDLPWQIFIAAMSKLQHSQGEIFSKSVQESNHHWRVKCQISIIWKS